MTRNYEKVAIEKDAEFVVNWGTIEDIAHNCLHKDSPHSQLMVLHNQPSHLRNQLLLLHNQPSHVKNQPIVQFDSRV